MDKKIVDMHVHSYCSDGSDSPAEIVKKAKGKGLAAISLTDHDTCQGLPEFMEAAERLGIEAIPGIEISSEHKGCYIHILGYGIDFTQTAILKKLLQPQREVNYRKAILSIERVGLDKLFGVKAENLISEIKKTTDNNEHLVFPVHIENYIAQYPEIFQALKSKRKKWKRQDNGAELKFISPVGAIKLINQLNGIAVLAHPGNILNQGGQSSAKNQEILLTIINTLKKENLFGIEARHPGLTETQKLLFQRLAQAKNLAATGGSDYHGKYRPNIFLGMEGGSYNDFLNLKQIFF